MENLELSHLAKFVLRNTELDGPFRFLLALKFGFEVGSVCQCFINTKNQNGGLRWWCSHLRHLRSRIKMPSCPDFMIVVEGHTLTFWVMGAICQCHASLMTLDADQNTLFFANVTENSNVRIL